MPAVEDPDSVGHVHTGSYVVVVEPGAVDEMRVGHAELRRAVIHARDEGRLAPGHVLGQCAGTVVRGGDDDRLEHLCQRQLLVFLEIDLAAALGGGRGRGGDGIVPADGAVIQRLHHQQQRHHLRHAGRAEFLMGVGFIQDLSGLLLHQDARRRGQLQILRRGRQRQPRQERQRQTDTDQPLFHKKSPFRFICTSV